MLFNLAYGLVATGSVLVATGNIADLRRGDDIS